MTPAGRFTVANDHPALPGHFPAAPVLPGVVLLDHVLQAVQGAHRGRRAVGLGQVKFLRPVRPGDEVEILAASAEAGRVAFACRVGATGIASGTVLLEPAA